MSDFLGRLAARAIAAPSPLRPRLAPRFAGTAPPPAATWSDRPAASVEQDAGPGRDPLRPEPVPPVQPSLPIAASRQDAPEPGAERMPACVRGTAAIAMPVPEPVHAPPTVAEVERAHPRAQAPEPFVPPDDGRAHEVPRARPAPPRRSASVSAPHDPVETAALATLSIAGPQVMTLLDTVSAAARPAAPSRRRSAAPEPQDVAASSSGTGPRAEPPFAKPPPSQAPQVAGQLTAMLAPLARPERRMAPAPAERAPDVSIVIHRLEVRTPAETPRPARRGGTAVPALSLDAYLKSRSRP